MNCTYAISKSLLAKAATPGRCSNPAILMVEMPHLDAEDFTRWTQQPFCKEHAAQMTILKYLWNGCPTPFNEIEIEFLVSMGYNRRESAPAAI